MILKNNCQSNLDHVGMGFISQGFIIQLLIIKGVLYKSLQHFSPSIPNVCLDPRSPTEEMERVLNLEPTEFRAVGCGWAGGSAGEGANSPKCWDFLMFF